MSEDSSEHLSLLSRRLDGVGITGQAQAWLTKALHPPAPQTSVALPDESFRASVRQDFRPSFVLSSPVTGDATWDAILVSLPGDVIGTYWCIAPSGVDFTSGSMPPGAQAGWAALQNMDTYQPIRTAYPDGSAGVVRKTGTPDSYPESFRTTYRSLTVHLTATSLYNGGTVTAAQFDREFVDDVGYGLTPDGLCCVRTTTTLPMSEGVLTQLEPKSVVWPAREGVYLPQRLLGPSQPFVTRARAKGRVGLDDWAGTKLNWIDPVETGVTSVDQGQTLCRIPRIITGLVGTDGDARPVGWLESAVSNSFYTGETGFDRAACAVVIFRGLSSQATLTVRSFVGIEMIPYQFSPLIAFVRAPCEPDARALAEYYRIASTMATVYPARFNSLGALLPFLAKQIALLGPVVAPYLVEAGRAAIRAIKAPSKTAPASARPTGPRKSKAKQ